MKISTPTQGKRSTVAAVLLGTALAAGSVLGLGGAASAADGDSTYGCRENAGCELTLTTDQCAAGATFWLSVWQGLGTDYQPWGHTNANCNLQIQNRMVDASETSAYNSGWLGLGPGTNSVSIGGPFEASKRCYTQVQVQRNDGSYLQAVHYNTRYWNDEAFRGTCITG